jgi:hypothetical protein
MTEPETPADDYLEQLGCTHRFRFPVVKLLDFTDRLHQLERDPNPFALVTAAHLYTARTRHDPNARYRFKRRIGKRRFIGVSRAGQEGPAIFKRPSACK